MNLEATKMPQCVGFIMDGNRRWAKAQGLEVATGHAAGKETLTQVTQWLQEAGIPHAVFYAFSTENWKRNEAEVAALMQLFLSVLKNLKSEVENKKIAVRIIGRRNDFSEEILTAITELEATHQVEQPVLTLWIALSYGGRAEIVAAVNEAVQRGESVDEKSFSALLWTAGMPDPDIIIRTGGEQRLSNFLPWQGVYSELFFTDTYWPAFTKDEFSRILSAYGERERRVGS